MVPTMTDLEGGLDEPTELEPEQGSLALVDEADRYSREQWESATAAVLRKSRRLTEDDADALVWEKLTRTSLEGVAIPPIGSAADLEDVAPTGSPGAAPYTRGRTAVRPEIGWDVRPSWSGGPDGNAGLNESVLAELETGATSLWFRLGGALPGDDLAAALAGVLLDLAPVVVESPTDPVGAAEALAAVLRDAGTTPADGTNLGADPVGARVRLGADAPASAVDVAAVVAAVAPLAREVGTLGLVVDGTALHDLGASDAQELGYVLAVGATYLRALVATGLTVDEALGLLEFRLAVTDEQFTSIAKLRAARRTWARLAELSGASPEASAQRQHAVTSQPMMSKYDPWVNMLRTTVAAFAAGVAGADAVTVHPFDTPLGVPDGLGRRIARNTSSLLIHESHVAKVADPAGGSYAVERLTDDLARAAWAELGLLEEAGGVEAALADGSLRARVDDVVARREKEIARRKRPLTGVSEFPNLGETLPERAATPADWTGSDAVRRYGASYEALRDAPSARPVFVATLGPIAAHTARATFVGNLLAAGGIDTHVAGATDGVDELVAAYRPVAGEQPVVCLAGNDKAYDAWGADAVAALREAGATWVVVAGKAGDLGVDDAVAMGVDALDFLTRTREKLA